MPQVEDDVKRAIEIYLKKRNQLTWVSHIENCKVILTVLYENWKTNKMPIPFSVLKFLCLTSNNFKKQKRPLSTFSYTISQLTKHEIIKKKNGSGYYPLIEG